LQEVVGSVLAYDYTIIGICLSIKNGLRDASYNLQPARQWEPSVQWKTGFAGHRSHRSHVTKQVTGHRSQVTGHRSQVTGYRSQITSRMVRRTIAPAIAECLMMENETNYVETKSSHRGSLI